MDNKRILTVDEIRKFLKISRSKAYELVNKKDFPIIRIDKNIRIIEKEFLIWLENQKEYCEKND